MLAFILNDQEIRTTLPPGTTLLDFIRYQRHLHGTKIGCREGDCGACTVLVGARTENGIRYRAMTSCLTPLANVEGKHVVTVEGINPSDGALTPVQAALVDENGSQCGFCTVGFVMALTGFCLEPTESMATRQAIAAMDGNICRCTGYKSIERAAVKLVDLLKTRNGQSPLAFAIAADIVPNYFAAIAERLKGLQPDNNTASDDWVHMGGGTDLYVQRHEEMIHAPAQYLANRASLHGIRQNGEYIEIGGATTVTDLLESGHLQAVFPRLREQLALVSSTPIRNMATLAGNLVNASPIGDLSIWFLALDAEVLLTDGRLRRQVALRDFFLGYKTLDKASNELVETIRFRQPSGAFYFNFEKVSKRTYLDIASVNSAIALQRTDERITWAHVSMGGVAPVPLYLRKTSAFLTGKMVSSETLAQAVSILQTEISPISDVRGSATYKRLLASRLFQAHFVELFSIA